MKVGMIVNNWPPVVDGVGDYTCRLSVQLAQRGIEVAVLCSANVHNPQVPKHLPIEVLPTITTWNGGSAIKSFRSFLREQNPDIVIWQFVPHSFHSKGLPWLLPLLLVISRFFCRTLVFFHEVRIKLNAIRIRSTLYGLPMFLISGLIHWLAHGSATSNGGYSRILKQYGKESMVIPIGSNIPFENLDQRKNSQKSESLSGKFILGSFGMGLRGVSSILQAIEKLKEQGVPVHFLVIGKVRKKERREIEKQLRERNLTDEFTLTGYMEEEDILEYLRLIDLYLMLEPSHSRDTWTGTSTRSGTLATALGMGLPILGVKGELTDDHLGEVIFGLDHLNGETLAMTVKLLVENPLIRQKKSQESQSFFDRNLNWERITNQYLDWIRGSSKRS